MPLYIIVVISAIFATQTTRFLYGIYRDAIGLNRPVVEQQDQIAIYIQPDDYMTVEEVSRIVEGVVGVIDNTNSILTSGEVTPECSQEVMYYCPIQG